MTSDLQTLRKLEHSLSTCIYNIPASGDDEHTHPITKLFLTEIDGDLQFVPKPAPTLLTILAKIAQNDPIEENSKVQFQRVKQLFASVSKAPLKKEDHIALKHLEHHLNALGSHIFIKRQNSPLAFLRTETLEQFQVRYSPPNQLPPPKAITHTLPNKTRKLCWLNATINYLTSTNLYDERLCQPIEDSALEGLRVKVFFIVEAMRSHCEQLIVDSLHEELIDYLKHDRFAKFLQGQQDCNDFLELLRNHPSHPLPLTQQVQRATIYSSFDFSVLKEGKEEPTSLLLQMPSVTEETIDIQEQLEKKHLTEGISNYLILSDGVWRPSIECQDPKICFQHQAVITHLPKRLELGLARGKTKEDTLKTTFVSQQKLHIDEKGQLLLSEYAPTYQELNNELILTGAKLKTICTYKVLTAIERTGNRAEAGHFVTYTRGENDSITKHSDRSITQNMTEKVWQQAILLQLECVERTPVNENF